MSTVDDSDLRRRAPSPYGAGGQQGGQYNGGSRQPGQPLYWDDESEFVSARPAGFRLARSLLAVVILAAIGYVVYTTGRNWFAGQIDPPGEPGAPVEVEIEAGSTTAAIGSVLAAEGVVPNSTFFRYYAQWKDQGNFQAGEYTFNENMSADEAIEVLLAGPKEIVYGDFVVPEGLWVSETVERIAEQVDGVTAQELQAVLDSGQLTPRYRPEGVESWEGLLFPSKYFIEEGITPLEIMSEMNDEFARVAGELGYGSAQNVHDMTAYEVIIIASLIEAEAKTDEDRPKIARVIYNRLRDNEWLGIDATYFFALSDRQAQLTVDLLESDENPYYSRRRVGLPPTPIAMPGRASLEAAMNPADGDWKYYVLCEFDGTHCFADTLEEHGVNVAAADELGLLDN